MHMDPAMPLMIGACLVILLMALFARLLRQPYVVAYIIAGVIIGPSGFMMVEDIDAIARGGAFGVVMLLFFVGMEVDPRQLIRYWKLAVMGTLLQIALSVFMVWLIGIWFDWPWARMILIGFVISLSSTAVVIKLLQENGMIDTRVGQGVLSILLAQDLAIVPMVIALGSLGGGEADPAQLIKQVTGTLIFVALVAWILRVKSFRLPLHTVIKREHELQLFTALAICFGLAAVSAWFELSTALGAFMAGLVVGAARETQWVHDVLASVKVLLLALFFVSVGMLLDLEFFLARWLQVVMLLLAVLITNTFINAAVLRLANFSWAESLHAGVLLSQVGEFSFVLAAVGLQAGFIVEEGYQLVLCVIALSLLVSPLWISLGRRVLMRDARPVSV